MIKMLKYGIYAKSVELLCFKPALTRLATIYPEISLSIFPDYQQKFHMKIYGEVDFICIIRAAKCSEGIWWPLPISRFCSKDIPLSRAQIYALWIFPESRRYSASLRERILTSIDIIVKLLV